MIKFLSICLCLSAPVSGEFKNLSKELGEIKARKEYREKSQYWEHSKELVIETVDSIESIKKKAPRNNVSENVESKPLKRITQSGFSIIQTSLPVFMPEYVQGFDTVGYNLSLGISSHDLRDFSGPYSVYRKGQDFEAKLRAYRRVGDFSFMASSGITYSSSDKALFDTTTLQSELTVGDTDVAIKDINVFMSYPLGFMTLKQATLGVSIPTAKNDKYQGLGTSSQSLQLIGSIKNLEYYVAYILNDEFEGLTQNLELEDSFSIGLKYVTHCPTIGLLEPGVQYYQNPWRKIFHEDASDDFMGFNLGISPIKYEKIKATFSVGLTKSTSPFSLSVSSRF